MTAASPGPRLLLVEDDDATRRLLASNLSAHSYRIDDAVDVRQALQRWDAGRPDLVLLDLGLPDRDGLAVIRRVRSEGTTPILILSARDGEADKIAALDAGADDYVTKPFALGELRARIAALLRRAAGPAADAGGRMSVGAVVLDGPGRAGLRRGRPSRREWRQRAVERLLSGRGPKMGPSLLDRPATIEAWDLSCRLPMAPMLTPRSSAISGKCSARWPSSIRAWPVG